MKIYNGANIKKKALMTVAIATLFFPILVSASTEWGGGVTLGSGGISSISIGIGSGSSGFGMSNPYGLPQGSILGIFSNLLFWLLAIFSVIGIIGFVIAGIMYLLSAGDENAISRAKRAMVWSIVGIIVGLSGYLIMQAVASLLNGATRF